MVDNKYRLTKILLIIISIFIAVTAFVGGIMLIVDPTGASVFIDQHLNKVNFVSDYFLMGILLIILISIPNIMATGFLFSQNNYASLISIFSALFLGIWVGVQLFFIGWFLYSILYLVVMLFQLSIAIAHYFFTKKGLEKK